MVLTDLKNNNSGWFRHYSPELEWKKKLKTEKKKQTKTSQYETASKSIPLSILIGYHC